ncbi:MBL fold metallo-hydrolase [Desulfonema magnum]|uniref:Beta-lactamase domain-containing protein n=1 Tax=Desulfonema magnum TaxID=45655 RepID=A0A975GP59_9BACT|nr:MBL fold metallo-hydrolase [Desulfonema magnum]QTA88499.1 Beta-lactamase domain-containing protein [Desulfonema magnum]
MYIKCWGSRGSVPVSGKEYVKYGGDTTCLEIRTKSDDIIIVDAGTGIRKLGNQLVREGRYVFHLIFTHAHWDHVMGFPFFKPIYSKDCEIRMHRCPFSEYLKKLLSKVMEYPTFPVKYSDIGAKVFYEEACSDQFEIGSVTITPIKLSHPNTGTGFKFVEDGKSFVFLTDNELGFVHPGGLPFEAYAEFCSGADLLFHDGEYQPEEYEMFMTWGHSAYTHALDLAFEAGVKKLGLFHLNQERADWQVDEIVENCKHRIAEKKSSLECCAVRAGAVFML